MREVAHTAAIQKSVVVVVALVLGVLVGAFGDIGGASMIAVVALIFAGVRPREATFGVLVIGLMQYLFTKSYPILPLGLTAVDDVLLFGVLIRSAFDIVSRKRTFGSPAVLAASATWVIVGVVNAVVHGQSLSTLVLALRGIALPVTLLIAAGLYFGNRVDRERVRSIVVGLVAVHAALSIAQWAGDTSRVDIGFGVLGPGGANAAGFLDLFALVLLLTRPLKRFEWIIAVLLVIAPITSSARAAIYVMPLALLTVLLSRGVVAKAITRGLGALAAAGVALWSYSVVTGRGLEDLAFQTLLKAQYNAGQGGRLLYLQRVPQVLGDELSQWLFGLGPGTFTSYVGVGTLAAAFRTVAPIKSGIEGGYASPDIEWSALLGEYGLVGTFSVLVMLAAPVVHWWNCRADVTRARDIIVAVPAIAVVSFVAMSTLNLLEFQPLAYVMWFVFGLTFSFVSAVMPPHENTR